MPTKATSKERYLVLMFGSYKDYFLFSLFVKAIISSTTKRSESMKICSNSYALIKSPPLHVVTEVNLYYQNRGSPCLGGNSVEYCTICVCPRLKHLHFLRHRMINKTITGVKVARNEDNLPDITTIQKENLL